MLLYDKSVITRQDSAYFQGIPILICFDAVLPSQSGIESHELAHKEEGQAVDRVGQDGGYAFVPPDTVHEQTENIELYHIGHGEGEQEQDYLKRSEMPRLEGPYLVQGEVADKAAGIPDAIGRYGICLQNIVEEKEETKDYNYIRSADNRVLDELIGVDFFLKEQEKLLHSPIIVFSHFFFYNSK